MEEFHQFSEISNSFELGESELVEIMQETIHYVQKGLESKQILKFAINRNDFNSTNTDSSLFRGNKNLQKKFKNALIKICEPLVSQISNKIKSLESDHNQEKQSIIETREKEIEQSNMEFEQAVANGDRIAQELKYQNHQDALLIRERHMQTLEELQEKNRRIAELEDLVKQFKAPN